MGRRAKTKTVVVTGATSGIGEATAFAFRDNGARIFLVGRSEKKLAATSKKVPEKQLAGSGLADLTKVPEIESLIKEIRRRLRRIDVLVLAAGEYGWTTLGNVDIDEFDSLFLTNVRAPYMLIQGLLPLLEKAKGQVIVLNSSIVKGFGEGAAAYKGTKHALRGLTDSLRQSLNTKGIRVTSLYPGRTDTPLQRARSRRDGLDEKGLMLLARDVGELAVSLSELPQDMEITEVFLRTAKRL